MRRLLCSATLIIGLLAAAPGASADPARDMIRADFVQVLAAGDAVMSAQSAFNAAKSAGDRQRMEDAAFDLLVASAAAAFWSAMLDDAVTAENTSETVDRQAAELRALAGGVFTGLAPIVATGDFGALTARLDESADNINSFNRLVRGIATQPGLRSLI